MLPAGVSQRTTAPDLGSELPLEILVSLTLSAIFNSISAAAMYLLTIWIEMDFDMFGHEFLPSPEWAVGSKYYAIGLGIFISACASWGIWKLSKTPPDTKLYKFVNFYLSRPGYVSREVRKKIGVVLIPVMGFTAGYALITDLAPLSITMAIGRETVHFYTVDRTGMEARCLSAVYLRDMPFGNNRICGLPDSFRVSLKPGNILAVNGVGTGVGIFVDKIRVVGDGAGRSGH